MNVLYEQLHKEGWIPCSERLPDNPEGGIPRTSEELEMMFANDKIKQSIVMIDGATEPNALFYAGEDRWYAFYHFEPYRVIAWQPLPEPYKGEERKED